MQIVAQLGGEEKSERRRATRGALAENQPP